MALRTPWCSNQGVPWCETCSRFLSPSTVRPDGACPSCGLSVDAGRARPPRGGAEQAAPATGATPEPAAPGAPGGHADDASEDAPPPTVPWHFKALVGALVIYLGYRFAEMGEWLLRRL